MQAEIDCKPHSGRAWYKWVGFFKTKDGRDILIRLSTKEDILMVQNYILHNPAHPLLEVGSTVAGLINFLALVMCKT